MQNITLIAAMAGLLFGVVGTVHGILNTWRAFNRDRVFGSFRLPSSMRMAEAGLGLKLNQTDYFNNRTSI